MHIPDAMLQGNICPITAIISAAGLVTAIIAALKQVKKPTWLQFSLATVFIFSAQMINFPIINGVSGHFLGSVFATKILGLPFAILSMASVIVLQAFLLSDGGITVIGANILNMSVIATVVCCLIVPKNWKATALASWLSVMAAALAVLIELIINGQGQWSVIGVPLLGIHACIGVSEAIITLILELFIFHSNRPSTIITTIAIILFTHSFACNDPDGLEWVAKKAHLRGCDDY
jgi:cobalt/nickel transport system permease protein